MVVEIDVNLVFCTLISANPNACESELVDIEVVNHSFPKKYYANLLVYLAIVLIAMPILTVLPTAAAVDLVKDRYFRLI